MKEHNKKTLIEALSMLPEYEPAEATWSGIERQLEENSEGFALKGMVKYLPAYEPPDFIWEKVEAQIAPAAARRVFLTPGWRKGLAAAATLAVVLFSVWLLNRPAPPTDEAFTLSYTTETVEAPLLVKDWNEDEDAFQTFLALCDMKKYICEQPEFRQLQAELEELTEAKTALESAIGDYGADAGVISQIKDIELERTDILKKMMVMLI
jgi:hypothetical protein